MEATVAARGVEKEPSELVSFQNHLNFVYTPCYCEENVYMLCKTLREVGLAAADASDLFIVIISNCNRKAPLWRQKSSSRAEGLCVWDYHVICIQKDLTRKETAQVWDLDTTLPFPVPLAQYVAEALQPWVILDSTFTRLYRVVSAPMYLRFFASDRRHMKGTNGHWQAPPPHYDCIAAEDGVNHNLEAFITMSDEQVSLNLEETIEPLLQQKFGVVLSEDGLQQLFTESWV